MTNLDAQLTYWNGAGAGKTFSHPVPLQRLRALLPPDAAILDYGCGYGRTCSELAQAGFTRVTGADPSQALIQRGQREHPGLDLRLTSGPPLPFPSSSLDACLLLAVLTCVPTDAGTQALVDECARLLKPGGLLFLSDYPLQHDDRNRARYEQYAAEFGCHGVFRAGEAVFRHFHPQYLDQLLHGFQPLWREELSVRTLNGNAATIVQLGVRKKGEGEGGGGE